MPPSTDLLQGTLDLLILQTLAPGPMHGWGVAAAYSAGVNGCVAGWAGIALSGAAPLEYKGWISSDWGSSENNRRAKYYALTAMGRKQLETELETWKRLSAAIGLVLSPG